MTIGKTLQIGLVALCLTGAVGTADARTHYRRATTDVAASPLPPPLHRNVRVANSADHRIRHHGVQGAFERLHRAHMRHRAKLYRGLTR